MTAQVSCAWRASAASAIAAEPGELPDTPYLAAGLKSDGQLLAIPDFDALKALFYK